MAASAPISRSAFTASVATWTTCTGTGMASPDAFPGMPEPSQCS